MTMGHSCYTGNYYGNYTGIMMVIIMGMIVNKVGGQLMLPPVSKYNMI